MKTFSILSGLAALVAAAPFPTGYPSPPYPPAVTGIASPTGIFPPSHNMSGYPPGCPQPTGTAPIALPTGTAPYKRDAQLGDMTALPSFSMPSFSMPSFSMPTGEAGSGFEMPTGIGSGSGSAFPTGGLDSGSGSSLPSMSLPAGLSGGSAAATGLSGFEIARRKAQFGGQPSFSFMPWPTASFAAPTTTGSGMPSFAMPTMVPSGMVPGAGSGVAAPSL